MRSIPRALATGLLLGLPGAALLGPGTTPAVAQEEQDVALRGYYAANGLLNRGLYDLAADEYRAFLAAHPDHDRAPSARYGLGVCLYRTAKHREALEGLESIGGGADFEFAAEVDMIRGQCRLALDEHAAAATDFERLLERDDSHDLADDAAGLLVEARYRAGAFEAARQACARLLDTWPASPIRERAELFDGLSAMALGEWAAAADRFAAMTAQFPTGAHVEQATLLLAQCAHRAERAEDAGRAYRAVITLAEDRFLPDALYGLALLLYEHDRGAEAVPLLDQMLARFADAPLADDGHVLRGRIAFDAGSYDEAIDHFAGVRESNAARRAEASYWTAKSELRLDRPADAAARLAALLDLLDLLDHGPGDALLTRVLYDLSVARVRSGDDAGAIAPLRRLLEDAPDDDLAGDARHLLAFTLHGRQEYDASQDACAAFLEAHGEHRGRPAIEFLVAENDYLRGRYDEAATGYASFLDAHPDDERAGSAGYRLGMTLYRLDRLDEAEEHLAGAARGADTDPDRRAAVLALGDIRFQRGDWASADRDLTTYLGFGDEVAARDDALLKQGLARQRQERWDEALASFRELVSEHPESEHVLHARFEEAQILATTERGDVAEPIFTAVAADDDSGRFRPHALNHLGVIAMNGGRHEEAADLFRRCADESADEALVASALHQSALAHFAGRSWDDAIETWDAFRSAFPDHASIPEADARRAIALARANRHEDALLAIHDARSRHEASLPDALRASLHYEEAWCLRELDRADAAAAAYRALLAATPSDPTAVFARLELAELDMDAERFAEAADVLDGMDLDAAPDDVREQALYRRGVCAFRTGDHEIAISRLDAMLEAYPSSPLAPSAGLLSGESQYALGNNELAAARLRAVVEDAPDDPAAAPALLRLGEAVGGLQRWDESEQWYNAYLEGHGDSETWYQARFGLGWARENQGRHEDAIADYRAVVDRHRGPTAARSQFQVGECLFALGRHEEAVRELLKVDILYDYPEWSAAALYEACRCFEAMSDPINARAQFERVRENHPETRWSELASERLEALRRTNLPGG